MNIKLVVFLSFPFTLKVKKKYYCEKWLRKCYFLLCPFVSLFFNRRDS